MYDCVFFQSREGNQRVMNSINSQLNQLSNPALGLPAVVGSIAVAGIGSRTEVGAVDLRIPALLMNYLDINIVTGNSIWVLFSF